MKKFYLLFYNLLSCLGWSFVLKTTISNLIQGNSANQLWDEVGFMLKLVQTSAILEVVHSAMGLVRSPIVACSIQVASRVVLLWLFLLPNKNKNWSLFLLLTSWSCSEIPRYIFYAFKLFQKKVPSILFHIRYNLFYILYPTGITGEILSIIFVLPTLLESNRLGLWYTGIFCLLIYIPGSPYMYFNMINQKKRASKNRNKPPPRKPNGIDYPVDKKSKTRSSTPVNKGAWVASLKGVDELSSKRAEKERNWRFGYSKHVVENVRISCKSTKNALKIAENGLNYLHNTFEFIRDDKTFKLSEAMKTFKGSFDTYVIKGSKPKPKSFDLEIPYKDKILKGQQIIDQLNKWVEYGTIEPSAKDAIAACAKNQSWLDLSDKYFVLLGAGSAMGPLLVLMSLGANVIAVDLDRDFIWKRLIKIAKESCGTMTFSIKKPKNEIKDDDDLAKNAGSNLFTDTPEIANWLVDLYPNEQFFIGGYAYLDGALFLKVATAMDAIIAKVCEKRKKKTGMCFLCSPTDVFICPDKARDEMIKNKKNHTFWWQRLIESLGYLKDNKLPQVTAENGDKFSIVDGAVIAQGPNYALSKRLQHWRCFLERSRGHFASTNIAPSTATKSVVHNKQFAAAYAGMKHFKPMEVMYQETSNAVMGALLIHDIRNKQSVAHPEIKVKNPLEIQKYYSFHGGIWRMAYKMDTIGAVSALTYYLKIYKLPFFGSLAAVIGSIGLAVYKPPHKFF